MITAFRVSWFLLNYQITQLHNYPISVNGIVGTWHKISAKHLPAYWDEMTFRFNNRFLFRDTLPKLVESDNLEYKELTKAA